MRGPTNSTDLVSAAALNTQWNVPRRETMKIHSCLFFVSMVASSRQLTCETNLGRPGKLANFSIANKRGRTESWTSSATDFLGCYSRIDVNAALLDSLKLNLTSFTRVHVADYFNLTLTAVRLLKPFLYHHFRRRVHIWFPLWHDMARFHVKIAEKWFSCASLKEPTDISVDCGTSSISLAIQICHVVYTGYNESQLILNSAFDNWTSRSPRQSTGSPSPPTPCYRHSPNACSSSCKVN